MARKPATSTAETDEVKLELKRLKTDESEKDQFAFNFLWILLSVLATLLLATPLKWFVVGFLVTMILKPVAKDLHAWLKKVNENV
jgi:uncharacterized membrane protein AbrB (regulator of aidB expression)